ncbi:outer membrane beta-barrel protein [Edaphobacter aggregans]|uniref:outer membrane beta-barrel protein n=1 Tax=Edaphobacter aggregans TaxID=570835 RepID=UPI0005520005|nr:outer membrane beta-barrel protein [Edaphobacter aggregans]
MLHHTAKPATGELLNSFTEDNGQQIVHALVDGNERINCTKPLCHRWLVAYRNIWIRSLVQAVVAFVALSAPAQQQEPLDGSADLALLTTESENPANAPPIAYKSDNSGILGPVKPEDLTPLLSRLPETEFTSWLTRERIRLYGWVDGGYTYSSAGDGLLAVAPTPNRFGNEWLINGAWVIVDRVPAPEGWSWGFRSDFYAGSDAALLRPLNSFGPEGKHLGTDFRQLYFALHMPVLSKRGVDLQLGRQNLPIGYETLMAPYRPLYSMTYFWIYFQVAGTSATATWHATDRFDLLGGVVMNYNTIFKLRGRAPSYIGKFTYPIGATRKTTIIGTVYTGPEPVPATTGHIGSWQIVAELQVKHNWSPRIAQVFQVNGSWDDNDPAVRRTTSATHGFNTITTFHLDKMLDLNTRGEWFYDQHGVRTGVPGTFGETTVGVNVMPTRWISFRPELRGDFAAQPSYGHVGSAGHKQNELSAAFDVIFKF